MSPQQQAVQFVARVNEVLLVPVILFLMALAFMWFLWGLAVYVFKADNETERATGRKHMLWGIVGLLVMISALTIIRIGLATFGLSSQLDCAQRGTCTYQIQR